jgi:hypothetical protein
MKVTCTTKVRVSGLTAGALRDALAGVPDEARMSVYKYNGSQMDQRDQPYTEITFTWSEERSR